MPIKVIEGHPYPYGMGEDAVVEGQKPDLRNKPKTYSGGAGGQKKTNNSRKSEASKQNKKRWY